MRLCTQFKLTRKFYQLLNYLTQLFLNVLALLSLFQTQLYEKQERTSVTARVVNGGRTHEQAANDVLKVGLISKFHLQI